MVGSGLKLNILAFSWGSYGIGGEHWTVNTSVGITNNFSLHSLVQLQMRTVPGTYLITASSEHKKIFFYEEKKKDKSKDQTKACTVYISKV